MKPFQSLFLNVFNKNFFIFLSILPFLFFRIPGLFYLQRHSIVVKYTRWFEYKTFNPIFSKNFLQERYQNETSISSSHAS